MTSTHEVEVETGVDAVGEGEVKGSEPQVKRKTPIRTGGQIPSTTGTAEAAEALTQRNREEDRGWGHSELPSTRKRRLTADRDRAAARHLAESRLTGERRFAVDRDRAAARRQVQSSSTRDRRLAANRHRTRCSLRRPESGV